jgi:anthranilate synthase component 1
MFSSVFDAFRLAAGAGDRSAQEREAMFFGGLFAYDLVAGFEDLPQLEAATLPGLLLLSGRTLLVIDHQKKHPHSGQMFTPLRRNSVLTPSAQRASSLPSLPLRY